MLNQKSKQSVPAEAVTSTPEEHAIDLEESTRDIQVGFEPGNIPPISGGAPESAPHKSTVDTSRPIPVQSNVADTLKTILDKANSLRQQIQNLQNNSPGQKGQRLLRVINNDNIAKLNAELTQLRALQKTEILAAIDLSKHETITSLMEKRSLLRFHGTRNCTRRKAKHYPSA